MYHWHPSCIGVSMDELVSEIITQTVIYRKHFQSQYDFHDSLADFDIVVCVRSLSALEFLSA